MTGKGPSLGEAVGLAAAIAVLIVGLAMWRVEAVRCDGADGTLVRGAFWWECVEEGEHP